MAKHPTTVVTLLKPVPTGLLDAVGLVSAGNVGDVLNLDSEAAVALVRAGVARYGSATTDPPAVAAPTDAAGGGGLTVAATTTTAGALVAGKHNPVDASGGAKAMTLPAGTSGKLLSVEKVDASTNAVTVSGNVRGVGGATISLVWQNEDLLLASDTAGSWWPVAGHKTKASLDAAYGGQVTDAAVATRVTSGAATTAALKTAFVAVVPPSGDTTGAADLAALNAILGTPGARAVGKAGGTYYINGPIILASGTELDMHGCTVISVAGTNNNLARNAATTAVTTASDAAITSGQNTVTSATVAALAAVGQTVVIAGAGGNGNGPLVANVSAVNGSTLTLVTLDGRPANATATVSAAAISLYNRDSAIRVQGGNWQRGTNTGATNLLQHNFFFRHVDGLTIDLEQLSSGAGKYGVSLADVSNYRVAITMANTFSDGVHVMGPAVGGEVTRIGGRTGDDSVSLTAADYTGTLSDCGGDIIGFRFGVINTTTNQSNFKCIAGAGRLVDDVVGGLVMGTPARHGAWIGDDTLSTGTTGGTYGLIDVGTVASIVTASQYQLYLNAPSARTVRARLAWKAGTGYDTGNLAGTGTSTSVATIQRLHLDLDVEGPRQAILFNTATMTVLSCVIDGRYSMNSGSGAVAALNTGTLHDLETRGEFILPASGGGVVYHQGAAMVVKTVRHTGVQHGGGVYYNGLAASTPPTLVLSGVLSSAVNALARVALILSPTTVVFAGATLIGVTSQPFRVTGTTLRVLGHLTQVSPGNTALIIRTNGTEGVSVSGASIPVDVSALTPTDGDMAFNNNAALACGVGPAVYQSTAAKWKNLYSGLTN